MVPILSFSAIISLLRSLANLPSYNYGSETEKLETSKQLVLTSF